MMAFVDVRKKNVITGGFEAMVWQNLHSFYV
jgi:hypothetical protein